MTISLTHGINHSISVNGREYPLNLEFSAVLLWYETMKDQDISVDYKMILTFSLLLDLGSDSEDIDDEIEIIQESIPAEDMADVWTAIIKRVTGKSNQKKKEPQRDIKGNLLEDENPDEDKSWYDLEQDADYIFSSFLMDYNLDLMDEREKGTLHWDKFNALLTGLSKNTKFKDVIRIRKMKIPEKASQEEKDEIIQAKQAVALEGDRESLEFELMDLKQKKEYMQRKDNG